ncbi:restriction endonuclease subunit S [Limnohabitans sp.]|uniref:restriction endonuclease subunit S n=1 Tax=Limnohabitans sp. TaxID=1907725 RepID=UPI00286F4DD2|nr:restriction endonuclease subunit S [Limnohabitans sp.]
MSAVLTAQEPSAKYLVNLQPPLVRHFDLIAQAPGGVARLRELILTLAVQGKLVPQDPRDEPASELLKKIRAEKDRLIAEGKIKRDKALAEIDDEEKPFELPHGWQWVRLGSVFKLEYGSAMPEKSRLHGDIPVYGSNGIVGFHNESLIQSPSLIVGRKGSVGAVNMSLSAFWPIDTSYFVTPPSGIDLRFSYFLFVSLKLGKHDKATAIPGINRNDVYKEVVALPPESEQSRIVTRVEELMQLCDALEAQGQLEAEQHARLVSTLFSSLLQSDTPEALVNNWQRIATHFDVLLDRPEAVDALEQTILQLAVRGLLVPQDPTDEPANVLLQKIRTEKDHLIAQGKIKRDKPLPPITDKEKPFELPQGWEWVRLGSLGVTQTGGTPASSKPEYFDGNFPFIGPGQITPNGQILSAEKFISELGTLESAVVEPGDILMVCIGGSIGKCAAATFPTAFNQQINSIHPLLLSSEYVLNAMSSIDFTQAVLSAATGSATPIISKGKWDLLLLPLPPRVEQSRIVTRVNELRSLCDDLRQRLEAAQAMQSHLADALVTG